MIATDLMESSTSKGLCSLVSVSVDQVFFDFTLKVFEELVSKKVVLEKSSFFLTISNIEEEKRAQNLYT
jgi:hypothetical protein